MHHTGFLDAHYVSISVRALENFQTSEIIPKYSIINICNRIHM